MFTLPPTHTDLLTLAEPRNKANYFIVKEHLANITTVTHYSNTYYSIEKISLKFSS